MMKGYGDDKQWPFAQGGGSTIGLVTAVWLLAVTLFWKFKGWFSGLFLTLASALWLLILYFFRDPNRPLRQETGLVVSPADGRVVAIEQEREERYLGREMIRISIFLSVTNVHIQRIPISGRVSQVEHRSGQFLQAFRPEASELNEHIAMQINTPYGPVLVKQIAGILARRCVNHMVPGDVVETGRRFGLIKFGSRVDLFLPPEAQLLIEVGDKVQGALTPIARLEGEIEYEK